MLYRGLSAVARNGREYPASLLLQVCYRQSAFGVGLTNRGYIRVAARQDIMGIIRATYLLLAD
jgi:hypothetical protein